MSSLLCDRRSACPPLLRPAGRMNRQFGSYGWTTKALELQSTHDAPCGYYVMKKHNHAMQGVEQFSNHYVSIIITLKGDCGQTVHELKHEQPVCLNLREKRIIE